MMTFLCSAQGDPVMETDEASDIRWMTLGELERILEKTPEAVFPLDVAPLKQYIALRK